MRGQNVRCRLELPLETRIATGGRTRQWPHMPEFGGSLSQLSATEQELWERRVERASYRLSIMARSIPRRYRDNIKIKNRIIILNDRNELNEEIYDIVGVELRRRARRINRYELILENIE